MSEYNQLGDGWVHGPPVEVSNPSSDTQTLRGFLTNLPDNRKV